MDRLDHYEEIPGEMRAYLRAYGWHFSKALCEEAVSKMRGRDGKPVNPIEKKELDELLKQQGVELKNNEGYDAVYVYCMVMADYYGSSITDKQHAVQFVKDYLDDPDGTPTRAMDEYMGRCIGAGKPIMWEDVL